MAKLNKSFIYKDFKKTLRQHFGADTANVIWKKADSSLVNLEKCYPEIKGDSKMMILPAAAIYTVLQDYDADNARNLLKEYGSATGNRIAGIIHGITSIPYVSYLLWKNMPKLMRKMSSAEAGYTREIVSETNELVGVDILSCPLHDAAVKIGIPEIATVVCAMDKAYMTGFKYINYTRTTSVAEGNRCCDYRLSFDKNKK